MPSSKNILSVFADNPALMDAVKAVLLKQFDIPDTLGVGTSDEVLGQYYRAKISGTKAVEQAFTEFAQYKTGVERPVRENPGR